MQRGEIWWTSLPEAVGSGPGFRRPMLIVQDDAFNDSHIATVIAVVITSNVRLAKAPGNVHLTARESGLPKPSLVNVSQIVTVDRTFLVERICQLSQKKMSDVDSGLLLVLGV